MKKLTILILLTAASAAYAQLDAIRTLTPEQGQEVRRPVEARIFGASQEEFPGLEQELLAIFNSPDTTLEGKQYTCRMLCFCASDACVPVLAPKLTDSDLSAFVRLVLQGLKTPAAEQALIAALPKTGNQDLKAGIIGTLGQHRGSAASVKAIAPYLKSGNTDLQFAAITALGNIGGMEATAALVHAKVKPALTDVWIHAQLKCAGTLDEKNAAAAYTGFFRGTYDDQIRAAALVGLVALSSEDAADLVLAALSGDSVCLKQTATGLLEQLPTVKLTAELMQMEPDLQIRVLGILADRKAADTEDTALQLAEGDNGAVREAAYRTLSTIGGVHAVEVLLARAPQDKAAFEALCAMKSERADTAVMQQLKEADDDRVKSKLLECLSRRKTVEALPLFVEEAKGDWSRSCKAAIDGMATLVSEKDFQTYADLLTESNDKKKMAAVEKSIGTAAQRLSDADACARPLIKAVDSAEGEIKYTLIRALGGIGGNEAKNLLIKVAKSSDAEEQDAAVRGLANWPTLDAAPILLDIATTSENEKHRVLALRGYIRLTGTVQDYRTVLDMCYKASDATDRRDELIAVISCVKKFGEPEVLDFLVLQLDNDEVYTEAATAILGLANHWKVKPHSGPALEKIVETAKNEELADRAKAILQSRK